MSIEEKASEPISSQESTEHVGMPTESDSTSLLNRIQQATLDYRPPSEKLGYISHPERKRPGISRENSAQALEFLTTELFGGSGEVE